MKDVTEVASFFCFKSTIISHVLNQGLSKNMAVRFVLRLKKERDSTFN